MSRAWPWVLFTLLLAAGSLIVFGRVVADPSGSVVGVNDDSSLFIWWLGHGAEVLSARLGFGTSPDAFFATTSMNALAGGVNGAWNTSVVLFAILLAPITWAAGPIVSYTTLIVTIPVLNGLAAAILFRRLLRHGPAFAAGAGVAFSSYVIAQLGGHPNLAFAVTPPLVAALILAILFGPRRGGPAGGRRRLLLLTVGLGLVLGIQFYVSTEILAGTFLAVCCLLIVVAVVARHRLTLRDWFRLVATGAAASALAAVLAAPLLLAMLGPGAPRSAIRQHGVWNTDLLDLIVPSSPTLLSGGASTLPRVLPLDPAEIGAYVGLPALILVVILVIALRHHPRYGLVVRIAAGSGLLVFVLAMGSPLLVDGRPMPGVGPFAVVEALPVLNNILPMRLVLHATIALWAILGCGMEWGLGHRHTVRGRALLVGLVVAAIVVMPGIQPARDIIVPDFYRGPVAEAVAPGSVVKTLPRPLALAEPHADEALVWQATAGFGYRETGGYFIGSTDDADLILSAPDDALDVLIGESMGVLPAGDGPEARRAFGELRDAGVDNIVVVPDSPMLPVDPAALTTFLTDGLGLPVHAAGGVLVFSLGD